jgi:biotin carboxyl carrier protein
MEVNVAAQEDGRYEVTIDGQVCVADARSLGERAWLVMLDGAVHTVDLEGELPDLAVHFRDRSVPVKLVDARRRLLAEARRRSGHKGGPTAVRTPMPGKVVKVLVPAGTRVSAGQGLLVVEAMKMENEMRAPRDGTVVEVRVREGQAVEAGETLAMLE